MPKSDLVRLECNFCGNYDTIDVRDPADKVMPIIGKWKGVMDGDSAPNQADTHRWYDSLECMTAGESKYQREKSEAIKRQAELDDKLRRANESLRKSGFMDKAAEVAKA